MIRAIFILIVFFSCKPKIKPPENTLAPLQMQAIMTDLVRADEYVTQFGSVDTLVTPTEKRIGLYQKVLKIHNVNKEQFLGSLNFYQNHPELLKTILDSIHSVTTQVENFTPDSTIKNLKKKHD